MPSLWRPLLGLLLAAPLATTTPLDPLTFDWTTIDPSPTLRYVDCYPGHQCARLTVPLDWLDPSNPHTATIALVKRPAAVPPTDPSHGGPVLLNPGGPGGSGVDFALNWGERLQGILTGAKHYDIIGFDPRGVGRTTPRANCYADELTRAYEVFQGHGAGELSPGNEKLAWRFALARSFGKRCGEELGREGGILRYASSSSVARDMIAIIDQIEELQERESERERDTAGELKARGTEQQKLGGVSASQKGPARLQYMGFSYGTLLGNTFASMFPGRVGRMVLDGVADIDDYMAGTWSMNLMDTDAAFDYLYQVCFRLGAACPMTDGTETAWQDIKAKVAIALTDLATAPVPVDTSHASYLLSDTDINSFILMATYKPNALFPATFALLAALLKHDHETLASILDAILKTPTVQTVCADCTGPACSTPITPDALAAISCLDGEPSSGLTLAEWADYFARLANQSAAGTTWSEVRFQCANWQARPSYRFDGPFSSPTHDPSLVEGKPAAPLLFVSSRIDPVTPLANAHAMAARHPGSAVVTQESVGHCALGTAVSSCTERIVRAYFETGTVPQGGAVCEADCGTLEACALGEEETAPIPFFGGMPRFGVDMGRLKDMSASLVRQWF